MIATLKKHFAIILIFSFTVVTGLYIYQDYGVCWDDTVQREIGTVSYNYVFHNDDSLFTYSDRDYGVAYELPLIMLEKALHLTDTRDIFLMRHLVTHLFFLCSMLVGYVLIYRLFRHRYIACLGFIMLVFHPRIYAHSFFNTKDVPFLSMMLLCLAAIYVMFRKDKLIWYVLAGFAVGYTCSTRVMGVIFFGFVSLFVLLDIIRAVKAKQATSFKLRNYIVFVIATFVMLYASWPYLWTDPLRRFAQCFGSFSHYRWEGSVLFCGSVIRATALPWTYVPVWIGITTPVLWTVLFIAGMILLIARFSKRPGQYLSGTVERSFIICLLSFLVPVLAVIVLHSVVYDDWRHLYFIYPPMVIIGLYAVDHFLRTRMAYIIRVLCGLQVVAIAGAMMQEHPFQQVYFNTLVSHEKGSLKKQFEMEYWGCSYKQGLEWLAEHDKSTRIKINTAKPLNNNVLMLPAEERARFVEVTDDDKPHYLLTNYRFEFKDSLRLPLVHRISTGNSPIMDIYFVEK